MVNPTETANSPATWDALWRQEERDPWRVDALSQVYDRVVGIVPMGARVVDIGGGAGALAARLRAERSATVEVWDHSAEALRQARRAGVGTLKIDLRDSLALMRAGVSASTSWWVATEVIEHFPPNVVDQILRLATDAPGALISVPNYRLGPDEEPQHDRKYSALEFLQLLRRYWGPRCRVEAFRSYLLGVCGEPAAKRTTLSVTLPVRDEAADIEAVLASFRGVADEIVVGVDPRTTDETREIARRYAEVVFDVEDPEGPQGGKAYSGQRMRAMAECPDPHRVKEGGVHFAWVRNQCMDRCTGAWIFMTEGHERLVAGFDALRNLDQLDAMRARVAQVWRTDPRDQRWGFPWLSVNAPEICYERSTHNSLSYPDGTHVVGLPQIMTLHDRVHERTVQRAKQRRAQNRVDLMADWIARGSEFSKYYLASEMREHSDARAIEHFRELLLLPSTFGPMRYQARLILAKLLWLRGANGDRAEARTVLLNCIHDDWSRTEHWVWLGDIAREDGRLEEALQFYLLGATRIGTPPFTQWWIDGALYSYVPAMALAEIYGELGDGPNALTWARRARDLVPEAAREIRREADDNVRILEEALSHAA